MTPREIVLEQIHHRETAEIPTRWRSRQMWEAGLTSISAAMPGAGDWFGTLPDVAASPGSKARDLMTRIIGTRSARFGARTSCPEPL